MCRKMTGIHCVLAMLGLVPIQQAVAQHQAEGQPLCAVQAWDCNNNQVEDVCDIVNGTSSDCDGNGIPDECLADVILLLDEFVNEPAPAQWDVNDGPAISELGVAPPSPPHSLRFSNTAAENMLSSVAFDLSAFVAAEFKYHWQRTGMADPPEEDDHLFVEYLNDQGEWITLDQHYGALADMVVFEENHFFLPDDALHASFRIRFYHTGHASDSLVDDYFVDDVTLSATPARDCNNNLSPDSCDIASGVLEDSDSNGIADSCQSVLRVPTDHATIQSAIDSATKGDTVVVSPGLYVGEGNRDLDFGGRNIVLKCAPGPETCTIDAGGSPEEAHRAFRFHKLENSSAIVEGFTITGGYWFNAIYGSQNNNESRYGGAAIHCLRSNPTIRNCIMVDNQAVKADAGLSTFTSGRGGAIHLIDSQVVIEDCLITGNHATTGGALFLDDSEVRLERTELLGNDCNSNGGAIRALGDSEVVARSSVIASNTAKQGAGIHSKSASVQLINVTMANNVATSSGGGLELTSSGAQAFIKNSILWGNQSPLGTQLKFVAATPVDISYSIVQFAQNGATGSSAALLWGDGMLSVNPRFEADLQQDFHLKPDSPAIDAGDGSDVVLTGEFDIDGDPRLMIWSVDLGADESRIANDCNENSISDGFETATGFTEDCNHNGIPDSCEPLPCTSITTDQRVDDSRTQGPQIHP